MKTDTGLIELPLAGRGGTPDEAETVGGLLRNHGEQGLRAPAFVPQRFDRVRS